ncbi:LytTR family DNA-binding domain-containing protein [Spirosoma fluviale]|uniref:LytTr DNA-binding domain-containing protein n=1 Tax=Spirosoma fluviale TaxID=1597977 RepID=A0A286FJ91_9BACT|nr:LytTR family DNA-binding domain-containing protein [Spirosoma fluviale]SOD83292.1 LytTr DNA-binding domain-containing protein [Spirosoma fluviale]
MRTQPNLTITIQIPGYRHIQDAQRIRRLQGSGNYTMIYLRDTDKPLLVSKTLVYFADQLQDFIRVSKSSLINPMDIIKVTRWDARRMEIELSDGTLLPVARRRSADLLEVLQKQVDRRKIVQRGPSWSIQLVANQPVRPYK